MSHAQADPSLILERENVELTGGGATPIAMAFMALGGAAIIATFLWGLFGDAVAASTALHAYHVGFITAMGLSLGGMVFTMIFHQTNAGWVATCRRQFENVMSLVWVGGILFVIGVVFQLVLSARSGAYLWDWMDTEHVAGDIIYEKKAAFLNTTFFFVRAVIYFGAWLLLSQVLYSWSRRQDSDGDKWLTAHMRKLSAPGLLIFAFTTAFAGFDWIMSLDYHWFSTMLGVRFFAGSAVSSMALVTLVLIVLRGFGRLHGAFNDEHLHDLGKLVFTFTVFWAYIAFSEYFLQWYANIPEEIAWINLRKTGGWEAVSWILPITHFIVPFVFLMARTIRRSRFWMGIGCLWLIAAQVIDWYWIIRPEAKTESGAPVDPTFLDVVGIVGPVLIFLGVLVRKIASAPLMPLKDPRLPESLEHKNYV